MNYNIPILSSHIDSFVRKAYYGKATDYYKQCGENLYYYDVNSLYKEFMYNKPYPLNLKQSYPFGSRVNLREFFGFCKVKVTCPDSIDIPILPVHLESGETVYPKGT